MITFASPAYFLLLLLLVPLIVWRIMNRRRREATFTAATLEPLRGLRPTLRERLLPVPFMLRCITLVLVIIVLARPQTSHSLTEKETEGIDIMLAMDISTSMMADDVRPNRMKAAKDVALEFIGARPNDNIGLTLFGGEAFTLCPATTDHATLASMFSQVSCELQAQGIIAPGTAIGMGITSAAAHLQNSTAKSRIIILLTDGVNNTGDISPLMAADIAAESKIRVYTILLGTNGRQTAAVATLPNGEEYEAEFDVSVDPTVLREIASRTEGKFYHATSRKMLSEVYHDIDQLEKTKLHVHSYDKHYEAFAPFALLALLCLLLEGLLRATYLRKTN